MITGAAPMSGADAAWLHMDRPRNAMVVTTILHLEGRPDWDAVEAVLTDRVVARFPRFRQRAVDPPVTLGLVHPRWREEVRLPLARHVTRTTARSLEAHIASRASDPLDRGRPLWHADLVDLGASSAVVLRTHHAMADGTALVRVLTAATDPMSPAPPPPSSARRAGIVDEAVVQREVRALLKLGERLFRRGDRGTPLTAPLSGRKSVSECDPVAVERLRDAGREAGATVNDVYLAAVAGALRTSLGPSAAGADLDAVMPVSVRGPDEPEDDLGNRFGLVVVPLPVATEDREQRRAEVARRTRAIKATTEAEVVVRALTTMGRLPRRAEQAWADSFIGDAVAVITNVAGPRGPVALAGTPVSNIALLVPSTGPIGLGVSLFSYAGRATASVIADEATLPGCAAFGRALQDELEVC